MRVCIVNIATGLVENAAELGTNLPKNCFQPTTPPDGYLWIPSDVAGKGWSYANGSLVPPVAPPAPAPAAVVDKVAPKIEAVLSDPSVQQSVKDAIAALAG